MKRPVTIYQNMLSQQGYIMDVSQVLSYVKDGRWKGVIANKDKENLPCFTVSGVFVGSKSQDNLDYDQKSYLLSLDLDDVGDKYGIVLERLSPIKTHIYSIFKSTSGKGLCVLVAIDDFDSIDDFKEIYHACYEKVKNLNEIIKFDYLPNLNRLRYVSYDPDLLLFENAVPFCERLTPPTLIEEKKDGVKSTISLDCNKLKGEPLTKYVDEKYTEIAGKFGANGKPRHDWVLGFARWACRAGVDQSDCQNYVLTNYSNGDRANVWETEVKRCVRDSYRTYQSEAGEYQPNVFDYHLEATNIEQVKVSFLAYIGKEEEAISKVSDQKVKNYLVKKVNYLKQIYSWL